MEDHEHEEFDPAWSDLSDFEVAKKQSERAKQKKENAIKLLLEIYPPSNKPDLILTLANETLIEIFSNFSYHELKSCRRVCKKFKQLYETKKFDARLFRTKPSSKALKPTTKIMLHPLIKGSDDNHFELVTNNVNEMLMHQELASTGCHREYKIVQIPCSSEFATYPSVTSLRITLPTPSSWEPSPKYQVISSEAVNKNGVTVVDVFTALAKIFDRHVGFVRRQLVIYDEGSKKGRPLCEEVQLENSGPEWVGWQDWESVTTDATGKVTLKAMELVDD